MSRTANHGERFSLFTEEEVSDLADTFLLAAQKGKTGTYKSIKGNVALHLDVASIVDPKFGANALHWAVQNGHEAMAKLLLEDFPQLLNSQSSNGATPLMNAADAGHFNIFLFLFNHKNTDISVITKNGEDIIDFGLNSKNPAIKKHIQEYIHEAYRLAAKEGDIERLARLLKAGVNIEHQVFHHEDETIQTTALFCAAATGNKALTDFLIKNNANLNVVGSIDKFTPLHVAIKFSHPTIVAALVKAGADLAARDNHNQTPLELAKALAEQHGNDIVKLLEKAIAEKNALVINNEVDAMPSSGETDSLSLEARWELLKHKKQQQKPEEAIIPQHIAMFKLVSQPETKEILDIEAFRAQLNTMLTLIPSLEEAGKKCLAVFNNSSLATMLEQPLSNEKFNFDEELDTIRKSIDQLLTQPLTNKHNVNRMLSVINGTCSDMDIRFMVNFGRSLDDMPEHRVLTQGLNQMIMISEDMLEDLDEKELPHNSPVMRK